MWIIGNTILFLKVALALPATTLCLPRVLGTLLMWSPAQVLGAGA